MNIQCWSPLGWTGWNSLLSKGLLRVFSSTTVLKHQFFGTQPSLWSNSHIHTWLLEKAIKCTSKLTWKSARLYLRIFPISHFGPTCSRNSFLPKDVEENYNHSLTWAHTSGSNVRIMGLTVSFLVTLQRWTQCHRSSPLPLTSMGWPQRISRQKGGWSLHVSPGFP